MCAYNLLICGPKFTKFLTPNMGGVVVDHLLFRFSFCRFIPELFVLKIDSSQKSRQILDVICFPIFWWGAPSKIVPALSHRPRAMSPVKVS